VSGGGGEVSEEVGWKDDGLLARRRREGDMKGLGCCGWMGVCVCDALQHGLIHCSHLACSLGRF
jgi:hypothetical protein